MILPTSSGTPIVVVEGRNNFSHFDQKIDDLAALHEVPKIQSPAPLEQLLVYHLSSIDIRAVVQISFFSSTSALLCLA